MRVQPTDVYRRPAAESASAWPAPSVPSLVLTAVVVFTLAAFVTSVAFLLHGHAHPFVGPFPHTQLEPFIRYHHLR